MAGAWAAAGAVHCVIVGIVIVVRLHFAVVSVVATTCSVGYGMEIDGAWIMVILDFEAEWIGYGSIAYARGIDLAGSYLRHGAAALQVASHWYDDA